MGVCLLDRFDHICEMLFQLVEYFCVNFLKDYGMYGETGS